MEQAEQKRLEQLERQAAQLLRQLGICPFRRGDRLLCQALALAAADPERLPEGMGPICAELARRNASSPDAVERALRQVLRRLWQQGDRKLLRDWFPRLEENRRPGSAAFLLVLSRRMQGQGEHL